MPDPSPTFWEAFRFWLKLGWISFGGPAGQIAIMHRTLIEEKKWVAEGPFLRALNFCMLLPGPEAQQLAIYLGWLLHGTWGGIVAGALFVLPSAFLLWGLSLLYMLHADTTWLSGVFAGLQPAVVAILIGAVWRIGGKTLRNPPSWLLALTALFGLGFLHWPFPFIVAGAAIVGAFFPSAFHLHNNHPAPVPLPPDRSPKTGWRRSLQILAVCLTLWWLPVLLTALWLGKNSTQLQMSLFFSKTALVTFGGAYAVLPYVSQQAVGHFGWLQPAQMLDGLGLAETTPGPLIMVLQFVGFVGAWQHPGALSPLWSATLGAFLTTWVTFLPCFLWIFLGAPYVEKLNQNRRIGPALAAITAAVVGVIAHFALWMAWQVIFTPQAEIKWRPLLLTLAALLALQRYRVNVISVILASSLLGLLATWLELPI